MNQTYIYKNGQQLGPFDDTLILTSLSNGTFEFSDLCSREGWEEWKPLGAIYPQPQKSTFAPVKGTTEAKLLNRDPRAKEQSRPKSGKVGWWSKPFGTLTRGHILGFVVWCLIFGLAAVYKSFVQPGLLLMPPLLFMIWALPATWKAFTKSEKFKQPVTNIQVLIIVIFIALSITGTVCFLDNYEKTAKLRYELGQCQLNTDSCSWANVAKEYINLKRYDEALVAIKKEMAADTRRFRREENIGTCGLIYRLQGKSIDSFTKDKDLQLYSELTPEEVKLKSTSGPIDYIFIHDLTIEGLIFHKGQIIQVVQNDKGELCYRFLGHEIAIPKAFIIPR